MGCYVYKLHFQTCRARYDDSLLKYFVSANRSGRALVSSLSISPYKAKLMVLIISRYSISRNVNSEWIFPDIDSWQFDGWCIQKTARTYCESKWIKDAVEMHIPATMNNQMTRRMYWYITFCETSQTNLWLIIIIFRLNIFV